MRGFIQQCIFVLYTRHVILLNERNEILQLELVPHLTKLKGKNKLRNV